MWLYSSGPMYKETAKHAPVIGFLDNHRDRPGRQPRIDLGQGFVGRQGFRAHSRVCRNAQEARQDDPRQSHRFVSVQRLLPPPADEKHITRLTQGQSRLTGIVEQIHTAQPPHTRTLVFGMPPVIRLTALGIRGVPESTKEAATAFGCTRWTLLKDIEIPLAMPSIMTGVNQTILMCLSMVVIASLIGAKGLGQDVLVALQYAAKGQGMLAGLAILFCAMVIDRIVQGHYKRSTARHRPGR